MTISPAGPTDWWARPLRPSDLARGADRWLLGYTGGGKDHLGILAAAAAVALWLLWQPLVAVALTLVGTTVGLTHAARQIRVDPTRRANALAPAVITWTAGTVALAVGWTWAASLLGLLAAELLARRPDQQGASLTDRWYSHRTLQSALVTAGVLPAGDTPALGYRGRMRRDDVAEWQQIDLPAPLTWQDVTTRQLKLAASLGLPVERLHVEHEAGTPATRVTLAVLHDQPRLALPAALPDRTDYAGGVPLGTDRLGRTVTLTTIGTHTVMAGGTGSGKTWLARLQATHAALDPTVPLYAIIGKDDEGDWRALYPLCVRYSAGVSEAAVQEAIGILTELLELSESRADDGDHPLVHVVVDEWFMLRTQAAIYGRAQQEALDRQFAILLATCRSRRIHISVSVQRGTVEYLPGAQRANVLQRCVGVMGDAKEIGYVLERKPLITPSEPGEFLVSLRGAEPTLVRVPAQDDQAFRAACARAARLRADTPPSIDGPAAPSAGSTLEDEVHRVLTRRGVLPTSALWDALPEDVRPGGANVLGRQLKTMPRVRRAYFGPDRRAGWEAVAVPRALPVAAPRDEQPVPLADAVNAPRAPHAHGAAGPETPAVAPAVRFP